VHVREWVIDYIKRMVDLVKTIKEARLLKTQLLNVYEFFDIDKSTGIALKKQLAPDLIIKHYLTVFLLNILGHLVVTVIYEDGQEQ